MAATTSLVVGTALGVMLGELYSVLREARAKSKKFDKALTNLHDTIELVTPKIKEIDKLNQMLGIFSRDEILVFLTLLEKGNDLVCTCLTVPRWKKNKRRRYFNRLDELDSTLRKLVSIEIQVEQLLVMKELLSEMGEINKKLDGLSLEK